MRRTAGILTILSALLLVGCTEEQRIKIKEADAKQKEAESAAVENPRLIASTVTFSKDMLALVGDSKDAIGAYEAFLSAQKKLEPRCQDANVKKDAFQAIWKLTQEADLVEGYVDFLERYPDAPPELLTAANDKICVVALELATKDNTIEAYQSFLRRFPTAPKEKRETALHNAAALKENEFTAALKALGGNPTDEQRKDIASRIMNDALSYSQKYDDHVPLEIAFRTFRDSKVLPEQVRLTVLSLQHIEAQLTAVDISLKRLRESVAQLRETALKEIKGPTDRIVEALRQIERKQDTILDAVVFPFTWDKEKSAMENFRKFGRAALPFMAKATAATLIKLIK